MQSHENPQLGGPNESGRRAMRLHLFISWPNPRCKYLSCHHIAPDHKVIGSSGHFGAQAYRLEQSFAHCLGAGIRITTGRNSNCKGLCHPLSLVTMRNFMVSATHSQMLKDHQVIRQEFSALFLSFGVFGLSLGGLRNC